MIKENWKKEHLERKHTENFRWCPLCVARANGEKNPPKHLVPSNQDPSQTGMDYLKEDYKPDKYYNNITERGIYIPKNKILKKRQ